MDESLVNVSIFVVSIIVSAVAGSIAASMKIGEYKGKVDGLETTIGRDEHNGLRKTVGDVRDKVVACETALRERGPLTQTQSPVSLTERGNNFLRNSGGRQFVDNNFIELLGAVDAMDPQTAYDVQEDSKAVIEELRSDDRINPIKEFLFKEGFSLDEAVTVMSIYLRNKVLVHKNWNVTDIDHQSGTDDKEPA